MSGEGDNMVGNHGLPWWSRLLAQYGMPWVLVGAMIWLGYEVATTYLSAQTQLQVQLIATFERQNTILERLVTPCPQRSFRFEGRGSAP